MNIPHNAYYQRPVLVTGGAGFIGSHIVERLVALQAQVTVLDNLSTGSLDNLASIRDHITFIKGDITSLSQCIQATAGIHTIFHLAASTSVPESFNYPEKYHAINVTGTFNLLEAARLARVQKFVLSSSAAVYGSQETPCLEETICDPLSPYGYSKLLAESYCKQYARLFGMQTICLRYFNVYGPRQDDTSTHVGVVAMLKKRMRLNLPITIYGDGTQTRDFVSVQHITQANLLLASLTHEYTTGEAINIASGDSISLITLIQRLATEYPGYTLPLNFAPARVGDIPRSVADCSRYTMIVSQKKYPPLSFYDMLTPDNTTLSV